MTDTPERRIQREWDTAMQELDALLIDALRLTEEKHPDLFKARHKLQHRFRMINDECRYAGIAEGQAEVKAKVLKAVG